MQRFRCRTATWGSLSSRFPWQYFLNAPPRNAMVRQGKYFFIQCIFLHEFFSWDTDELCRWPYENNSSSVIDVRYYCIFGIWGMRVHIVFVAPCVKYSPHRFRDFMNWWKRTEILGTKGAELGNLELIYWGSNTDYDQPGVCTTCGLHRIAVFEPRSELFWGLQAAALFIQVGHAYLVVSPV